MSGRLPPPTAYSNTGTSSEHIETPKLGLFEGVPQPPPIAAHDLPLSEILPNSIHSIQNSLDTAMDTADLCHVMRAGLQTTSDEKKKGCSKD